MDGARCRRCGADAETFLDRLIANHVPRRIGGIVLTHLLNERGTVEAEVTCARLGDEPFYLMFAAFHGLRVLDWLNRHRERNEWVSTNVVSEDYGCLVLSGPRSRDVLRRVTQAPLDNAGFPWLRAQGINVAGVEVRALRMSYVGELGWELHVPMAELATVYDALWQAGEEYGIGNFGSYALNAMRLEKGFKGASELTNEVTLPEADVMRFVKLDKGDFVGRAPTIESLEGPLPWICAISPSIPRSLTVTAARRCWRTGAPSVPSAPGRSAIAWERAWPSHTSPRSWPHRTRSSRS